MTQRQKKQFLVMCVLLVLGIFAYVGVRFYNQKQEEKKVAEEEQGKIVVTDFKSDDVTAFSYQYEGELLEFVKEDGTWYYKEDRSIAMDQDKISSMLDSVSELNAEAEVSGYETLADYGLDQPGNTIVLTAEAETVTLLLGDKKRCGARRLSDIKFFRYHIQEKRGRFDKSRREYGGSTGNGGKRGII